MTSLPLFSNMFLCFTFCPGRNGIHQFNWTLCKCNTNLTFNLESVSNNQKTQQYPIYGVFPALADNAITCAIINTLSSLKRI